MPEKWGGLGASAADLATACEELGHHAVPGPVAESLAAVPALLATLAETDWRTAPDEAESPTPVTHRPWACPPPAARPTGAGNGWPGSLPVT